MKKSFSFGIGIYFIVSFLSLGFVGCKAEAKKEALEIFEEMEDIIKHDFVSFSLGFKIQFNEPSKLEEDTSIPLISNSTPNVLTY